jgi:hypothetical protein
MHEPPPCSLTHPPTTTALYLHAGVILDGREADQVVAEAWLDVGGRVAQQLLEGGTATVKVALEGAQAQGGAGGDAAELTSVSQLAVSAPVTGARCQCLMGADSCLPCTVPCRCSAG